MNDGGLVAEYSVTQKLRVIGPPSDYGLRDVPVELGIIAAANRGASIKNAHAEQIVGVVRQGVVQNGQFGVTELRVRGFGRGVNSTLC